MEIVRERIENVFDFVVDYYNLHLIGVDFYSNQFSMFVSLDSSVLLMVMLKKKQTN